MLRFVPFMVLVVLASTAVVLDPPAPPSDKCEGCKKFVKLVETEGCDLACDALPAKEQPLCKAILSKPNCDKIVAWLEQGSFSAEKICGLLEFCKEA
jgi:hypothetical protein